MYLFLIFLLSLFHSSTEKAGDFMFKQPNSLEAKIFVPMPQHVQCYRFMNGTHQFGCQADYRGQRGIIFLIDSVSSLTYVTKTDRGTFVAFMDMSGQMFTEENLEKLRKSDQLNGLILHGKPKEYSSDSTCPNRWSSVYVQAPNSKGGDCPAKPWNPPGQRSLTLRDWNFPVAILRNKSDVARITKCFQKYNTPDKDGDMKYPLCSAEFSHFQYAARSSKRCIYRNTQSVKFMDLAETTTCEPFSGTNIYAFYPVTSKAKELGEKSILVIATRLDSFDGLSRARATGQFSVLAGLVAFMAIAEKVAQTKPKTANGKHVLFVLFDGETFDYIGSGAAVFEIEQKAFPTVMDKKYPDQLALFDFKNIADWIEIGQVGFQDEHFLHSDAVTASSPKSVDLAAKIKGFGKNIKESGSKVLPPSSAHSFLKKSKFPAVLVTDFAEQYSNKYYNSHLDRDSEQDLTAVQGRLNDISTAVGKYAIEFLTGKAPTKFDDTKTNKLTECVLDFANCSVFRNIIFSEFPKAQNRIVGARKIQDLDTTVGGMQIPVF